MERRPELTIIAGPNGVGKSRLCPFYVSKSQTHKVVDNPPLWFKEQFEELFANL